MARKILLIVAAFVLLIGQMRAENPEAKGEEKFNASETILHHILDSHDWHITDFPTGSEGGKTTYTPIALHLPWILYSSRDGLCFYANSHALEESGKFGLDHHGAVFALKAGANPHEAEVHTETPPAHAEGQEVATPAETEKKAEKAEEHHNPNADESVSITDMSITKTALQIMLVALVMVLVFTSVARAYAKNVGKAPSGTQSLFEPIIIFVRDLAKEYLGNKHEKFVPYLLTLFFFIWFSNLFGLTPFNSNIAGNISVTAALALLSFILITINGSKDYWHHIFAMPGVPKPMLLLLTPIEIMSMFIKPAALAIRLFANIVAGHFMVLALICMTFILGDAGKSVGGGIGGTAIGIPFAVIIYCLEMLVAIIQAYIFTLLTTVFISMALESHDDHAHGHDEQKHNALDSEVNKDLRLSDFGV